MKTATRKMTPAAARAAALRLCGGHYQRAVVLGQARISGSDLRGRAAKYGARYHASRRALLARLAAAGIPYRVETRAHGLRVLVWGTPRKAR